MTYVSSMVTKYGDVDNVKRDVATIVEILDRQGSSLLIDVVAEQVGRVVSKYDLSNEERTRIVMATVNELEEALLERT